MSAIFRFLPPTASELKQGLERDWIETPAGYLQPAAQEAPADHLAQAVVVRNAAIVGGAQQEEDVDETPFDPMLDGCGLSISNYRRWVELEVLKF